MWFQVPAASAKFLSDALRALAEQARLSVDVLCTQPDLLGVVVLLEGVRSRCLGLTEEFAVRPGDGLYHLVEAKVSLLLKALDTLAESPQQLALIVFFSRWMNREQFLLVPDVDDVVDETHRATSSQPS